MQQDEEKQVSTRSQSEGSKVWRGPCVQKKPRPQLQTAPDRHCAALRDRASQPAFGARAESSHGTTRATRQAQSSGRPALAK